MKNNFIKLSLICILVLGLVTEGYANWFDKVEKYEGKTITVPYSIKSGEIKELTGKLIDTDADWSIELEVKNNLNIFQQDDIVYVKVEKKKK